MTEVANQHSAPSDGLIDVLFQHSPISMQIVAASGETIAVNRAWERLWGATLTDLGDVSLLDDPQLAGTAVPALLRRAFAGESVALPPIPYQPPRGRHAGQRRWVRALVSPVRDAEGAVTRIVLVHDDVTDLMEAQASAHARQERIERSQALLEESQRSARLGTWEWDLRSGELTWTDELYRVYGLEPGAAPPTFERFIALVHPDDREAVREAIERAYRHGTPLDLDHRVVWPDASVRSVHARGRVVLAEDGAPAWLVGSSQDVTDRLRAAEIERTFDGLWEHAPVGIAVYDAASLICARHNRRFLDLVGAAWRRRGSVAGVPLRDLFDRDSYERVRPIFEQVRDTREAFAIDEFPAILPPEPEPRYYQWSLTPVAGGDRAAWLVVTAVEVTALVRTRRRQQALLDSAVEGIVGLDAEGRCTFINRSACRLLGFAAEEWLGHDLHELVHARRPDGSPYPIADCPIHGPSGRGQSVPLVDETLWRRDGTPLRILYSASPILNAEGELAGAVASILDNEERRRADEALRASEARFRSLLDSTVAGVVLGSADGSLLYANDAYLRIVGYERDDFDAGRVRWIDLTPPEWLPADERAIAEARERGSSAPYEKEYIRQDGSRVPVLLAVTRTEAGGVEQLVGLVLDIRERKRLDRLRQDFLAMVTHDLRTPLTTVRAGAQLLKRRGEYRQPTVDAILSQADRMQRLIDDLADVVRLEGGQLPLRRTEVDLASLARAQAEAAQLRSDRHRFVVDAPREPVVGSWDGDRLAQVLHNLLANAITHGPDGGDVVVRVATEGAEARMSVTDRGPGIAPEHVERLFERFYRAEATGAGGLGMGLYISRMLVEAHGGRIWVDSLPGRGSSFVVALPLAT